MTEFDEWIRAALQSAALALVIAAAPVGAADGAAAPTEPAPGADERVESRSPSDGEGRPAADGAPNAPTDAAGAAGRAGAAGEGESPAVFIPSEEISEDFAVAFPVDI